MTHHWWLRLVSQRELLWIIFEDSHWWDKLINSHFGGSSFLPEGAFTRKNSRQKIKKNCLEQNVSEIQFYVFPWRYNNQPNNKEFSKIWKWWLKEVLNFTHRGRGWGLSWLVILHCNLQTQLHTKANRKLMEVRHQKF